MRQDSNEAAFSAFHAVVKFDKLVEQTVDRITRFSGFVPARHFIPVIEVLDLEANPRSSKVGQVTAAIRDSIENTPDDFPFKTKGILLGASDYRKLDRDRIGVNFADRKIEGILDGGHNTLAIGLHVLSVAGVPEQAIRKVKVWSDFRDLWHQEAERVDELRAKVRRAEGDSTELDFLIPVELIVPSDVSDTAVVEAFESSILDICAARNNNVQLRVEAKANKRGYFDDIKQTLPKYISDRVEWQQGDPKPVKVADVVALAWVPLALLEPMPEDDDAKAVTAPLPQNLYRNKGDCIVRFERLMSSPSVTCVHGALAELRNLPVFSALTIAGQMPELYELIYRKFPIAYNQNDGRYGAIVAVRKMNPQTARKHHTKFSDQEADYASPEGFIIPLVYGLTALLERRTDGTIAWKTDPIAFLNRHLGEIAKKYKMIMQTMDFDPQKIGKSGAAYELVRDAYTNLLLAAGAA
ncbi:hypothetical protein [Microbacterium rhizosphaerae]|uniref:AIPR family protein n=1 Tax=Microbacterium rhizosphaerae TaxID=1678237 RepID=A0ABZ0SIQ3_9MICO|nr:hypothetical protein [Microbacterium rhizosphaerae]WPR88734.1 hypothetical protein SM116_13280 [Microbacterium rhizosphaerae]